VKDQKKGYMVDVARAIFERKGHNIDYQVDTWSNSLKSVRDGKATGIIAANVYDAPDFVFPKNSLGYSKDCFFVKPKDKWEYKDANSLAARKLGVVSDYAYSRTVNQFLKEKQDGHVAAVGENALELLSLYMIEDKIDTIVENPIVFNYFMDHNLKETHYEEAGCAESSELYIAFSPKNPRAKEFAQILSDGLDELRKDGTLEKIIKKYDLKEWK
jgi:polar amino acid transport system substrate-binding protein